MAMLTLEVRNQNGETLASVSGENSAALVYPNAYAEGDTIVLKSSETGIYLMLQVDDALGSDFVSVSYTHLDVYKRQGLY